MDRSQVALRVNRGIDRIVDGLVRQGASDEALAAIRAASHKDPDLKRLRVIEAIADAVETTGTPGARPSLFGAAYVGEHVERLNRLRALIERDQEGMSDLATARINLVVAILQTEFANPADFAGPLEDAFESFEDAAAAALASSSQPVSVGMGSFEPMEVEAAHEAVIAKLMELDVPLDIINQVMPAVTDYGAACRTDGPDCQGWMNDGDKPPSAPEGFEIASVAPDGTVSLRASKPRRTRQPKPEAES